MLTARPALGEAHSAPQVLVLGPCPRLLGLKPAAHETGRDPQRHQEEAAARKCLPIVFHCEA